MKRTDRPSRTASLLGARLYLNIIALIALLAGLSACTGQPPAAAPISTPVDTEAAAVENDRVVASAVIVPAQMSEMGLVISGPVREISVSEGDQVQRGQTLVVLATPELEYSIAGAEAALRAAQADARLQRYRNKTRNQAGKVVYLSGPRELIEIADAKVEQAQAALVSAQAALAQGALLAPFDGTIVRLNITPGEFVQPGRVVAVIGDLAHLQVETTDLSERAISEVKPGQAAIVSVDALHAQFNGTVTEVSPVADIVGGDVVFKVTVELDEQPDGLLWGMNAEVEILTS